MTYELNLQRQIAAPPEAVFAAFVDAEAQAEWFKEPGDELLSVTIEARVGGTWEMVFRNEDRHYRHTATFTEVDAPHRLALDMTHHWPGDEQFTTRLVVTFTAQEGGTLFALHETFEEKRHRDILAGGWPGLIDILKDVVERGLPAGNRQRSGS